MANKSIKKGEEVRLRILSEELAAVIRAAELSGVQVNEFIVGAALAKAEQVLAEGNGEASGGGRTGKSFTPLAEAAPRVGRTHGTRR